MKILLADIPAANPTLTVWTYLFYLAISIALAPTRCGNSTPGARYCVQRPLVIRQSPLP